MSDRFAGRRALVTGAGSGIGEAIARGLLAEGAGVEAVDLAPVDPTRFGGAPGLRAHQLDVSDEAAVAGLGAELQADPPTLLFNVAGIGSTVDVTATSLELWERVFAVNVTGTFLMCRRFLPAMIERGQGAIVNIASIAGLVGLRNRAAYCASKGAVVSLTRAMAVDHVGAGVRVNCVCPGTVDSPWVRRLVEEVGESLDALRARQPMGRLGTPEEVARAALYLASEEASFATGTVLTLDGGLTAA